MTSSNDHGTSGKFQFHMQDIGGWVSHDYASTWTAEKAVEYLKQAYQSNDSARRYARTRSHDEQVELYRKYQNVGGQPVAPPDLNMDTIVKDFCSIWSEQLVPTMKDAAAVDPLTKAEMADILDAAADKLDEGWIQGAYSNENGHCGLGAISHVLVEMGDRYHGWFPLNAEVKRLMDIEGIASFNDAPGRTKEEVQALLRDSARFLRKEHELELEV